MALEISPLYEAARRGDVKAVEGRLVALPRRALAQLPCELNPLLALTEANKGTSSIAIADMILAHEASLLHATSPNNGANILHLAAEAKKEALAIYYLKSFLSNCQEQQCEEQPQLLLRRLLAAHTNDRGETPLHIATRNLLPQLVAEILSQTHLKVNATDGKGHTTLDVIHERCGSCTITQDWRTPWKISLMLRNAGAMKAKKLEELEEDEYTTTKQSTTLGGVLTHDGSWSMMTSAILVVATLALSLVFAAIFTVPQSLQQLGVVSQETMQKSLTHNTAFIIFVLAISTACLLMSAVIGVVFGSAITSELETRAFTLFFSWICGFLMCLSLCVAYLSTIYMYMGSLYVIILICFGLGFWIFLLSVIYFLHLMHIMWDAFFLLLSLSLIRGLITTLLLTCFPRKCVLGLVRFLIEFP